MFQLDLKSRKSIYEQVIDNLKELIMTGRLAQGEKLPSVRELSKTITVNPNTVQKAYRELERQGYVYTTSGVGTFVADRDEIRADARELEAAKAAFDELGVKKLPKIKEMSIEYAEVLAAKKQTYAEYRLAKNDAQELLIAQQNIASLYDAERKEEEQKRRKDGQSH